MTDRPACHEFCGMEPQKCVICMGDIPCPVEGDCPGLRRLRYLYQVHNVHSWLLPNLGVLADMAEDHDDVPEWFAREARRLYDKGKVKEKT